MEEYPRRTAAAPDFPLLRIAHVSTQKGWRGGEGQMDLLIRGQKDRGHRVLVLARNGFPFADRMAGAGVDVAAYKGSARSPRAILQMRKALRAFRPHVLHFHEPHGLTAGGLAAVGLPIPARICHRRVDFPIRSTRRYKLFCDRVIAISDAVHDVCVSSGISGTMLRRVYSGVDPARMHGGDRARGRAELGLRPEQPLALVVAALTDHKGHTYLLQALGAVKARHPDLVVALAGDGELEEPLREEARKLQLDDTVRFLGYRDDIPDLMHAADLFVMPSKLEGLGTSMVDAMVADVPVVCTTAGGLAELSGAAEGLDPPVAFTCDPQNPDALAAALLAALSDPQERARRAARARQRAEDLFVAERMVEGVLEVYREVLRDKHALPRSGEPV